ncbi:hypothetical protein TNCV_4316521 [Trichonephila clavipes]|nr:hypothetical protein TNCV_4316521 [Trichonephila clavipes]
MAPELVPPSLETTTPRQQEDFEPLKYLLWNDPFHTTGLQWYKAPTHNTPATSLVAPELDSLTRQKQRWSRFPDLDHSATVIINSLMR